MTTERSVRVSAFQGAVEATLEMPGMVHHLRAIREESGQVWLELHNPVGRPGVICFVPSGDRRALAEFLLDGLDDD